MPPTEILASGYTSKQSDVYQVGLLLYWMLTGQPAIDMALPYQDLVQQVADGAPRRRCRSARDCDGVPHCKDAPPPGGVPVLLGAGSLGGPARAAGMAESTTLSPHAESWVPAQKASRRTGPRARSGVSR